MFVDIFLENLSIDFDQNHSKCRNKSKTVVMEKIRGLRGSFSRKLRICLQKQPNFENLGFGTKFYISFRCFFFIKFEEGIT